jgi:hypothetical protein
MVGADLKTKLRLVSALTMALPLLGCDVSSPSKGTGGVQLGGNGDGGGADSGGSDGGTCPRALAVVDSDYTSTNVSILSPEGKVLSESIVSSGSATAGVTTALSGDVAVPTMQPHSGQLVLVDRSSSVLTWMDPTTAKVLHQLPVGTGFDANPYDYLEVSATKAYVVRYNTNATPGKEPFDGGGDVLVIDPSKVAVTGSIPLAKPDDGAFLPRPNRIVAVGDVGWVMLERLDASFTPAGASRIAGIDTKTDTIAWTLDLPGAENCGGLTLSPSGKVAAVSCSGDYNNPASTTGRPLILLDATQSPPKEIKRVDVKVTQPNEALGPGLAFASETLLIGVALADGSGARNDLVFTLDTGTGAISTLLDGGASFVIGDVRCTPGCSNRCFITDAHANAVRTFTISGGALTPGDDVSVDPSIGLPPRSLGVL